MSSYSFLVLWCRVKEFQDFLIDYLHPLFRIKKNEPKGEVNAEWEENEWNK